MYLIKVRLVFLIEVVKVFMSSQLFIVAGRWLHRFIEDGKKEKLWLSMDEFRRLYASSPPPRFVALFLNVSCPVSTSIHFSVAL